MKKTLSLILAVTMVLSCILTTSISAFAADNEKLLSISNQKKAADLGETSGGVINSNPTNNVAPNESTYKIKVKVVLNPQNMEMTIGENKKIVANVASTEPIEKSLVWQTEDDKIATVDSEGNVIAVAEGTTKITCTVYNTSTNEAVSKDKCIITVKGNTTEPTEATTQPTTAQEATTQSTTVAPETTAATQPTTAVTEPTTAPKVLVSSIDLVYPEIRWKVGTSAHYYPKVGPSNATNQKLVWSSSNPKVATISQNGLLTAVSAGKTTITCRAADGSGVYDTGTVEVWQPVTSIKLNTYTLNWKAGEAGTFRPTVNPSNATNSKLSWSSSNTKVATINQNGKVTAVSAGTATLTAKSTDGTNVTASCKITVTNPRNYTDDDLFCLAAVIWQEAGASYASDTLQIYVANVVMNHVNSPYFPNTIRGVLTRPYAYGTMAWTGISIPTATNSYTQQAIDRCYANAKKVLEGYRPLPSSIIYQAGFTQGSGVYAYLEGVYFCYQ